MTFPKRYAERIAYVVDGVCTGPIFRNFVGGSGLRDYDGQFSSIARAKVYGHVLHFAPGVERYIEVQCFDVFSEKWVVGYIKVDPTVNPHELLRHLVDQAGRRPEFTEEEEAELTVTFDPDHPLFKEEVHGYSDASTRFSLLRDTSGCYWYGSATVTACEFRMRDDELVLIGGSIHKLGDEPWMPANRIIGSDKSHPQKVLLTLCSPKVAERLRKRNLLGKVTIPEDKWDDFEYALTHAF